MICNKRILEIIGRNVEKSIDKLTYKYQCINQFIYRQTWYDEKRYAMR